MNKKTSIFHSAVSGEPKGWFQQAASPSTLPLIGIFQITICYTTTWQSATYLRASFLTTHFLYHNNERNSSWFLLCWPPMFALTVDCSFEDFVRYQVRFLDFLMVAPNFGAAVKTEEATQRKAIWIIAVRFLTSVAPLVVPLLAMEKRGGIS